MRLLPDNKVVLTTGMTANDLQLANSWGIYAQDHQRPPLAAKNGEPWTTWLILGGRGAGKTRAGAEWVRELARKDKTARIALIGETEHEVREVMVEGVSGLLAVHCLDERPQWMSSRGRLEWKSGAVAQVFTAENYESLRGPQFSAAWLDELAKWRHAESTFNMLQFGLRLGERPRQVVTTTPRPIALLKKIIADPATAVTHAATTANARNLSPVFLEHVLTRYGGTRLGRQEIDGEIVEERNDALWSRAGLEACRVTAAPAGRRAGRGNQHGRRYGARRDARGGCERAGADGARDARQVPEGRTDFTIVRAGPSQTRRRVSGPGR